ncbi:MAG: hypothetical protein IPL40_04895 [Proteobacteria bacterium]|nr:hypothetical protein [Pseudomonadota bacterium]
MPRITCFFVLCAALVDPRPAGAQAPGMVVAPSRRLSPDPRAIVEAFGKQGIRINLAEARGIAASVAHALGEARQHGIGNSKVDFEAIEIAQDLGLDTAQGSSTVRNVVGALRYLLVRQGAAPSPQPPPRPPLAWGRYFDKTVSLWTQPSFMTLLGSKGFHPVKISWEDIGRQAGSSWGDRISDVGIWVRRDEAQPGSARLALSVRRDSNYRDKVLVVPAERIKVHLRSGQQSVERSLPQRLRELGLASRNKDRNVIVSNQFAIVPVPSADMRGAWRPGHPPRAAFTFSIFPYGSTNFVITDVIEGSHEAIVGPGTHQLLFANVGGRRAPFTASRAADRPDLLALERELRAQGMDVDVQRYYLIQIPLRKGAAGLELSNMGAPPLRRRGAPVAPPSSVVLGAKSSGGGVAQQGSMPASAANADQAAPAAAEMQAEKRAVASEGLAKVAIGTGQSEGRYRPGAGWRGKRAEEPIRVTVVYFVTPVGELTSGDMARFAQAFGQWDSQAIWGGSFVTKESW